MDVLVAPLIRGWQWVERVGGFPGQAFVVVAVVMLIIGVLTWFGNRK